MCLDGMQVASGLATMTCGSPLAPPEAAHLDPGLTCRAKEHELQLVCGLVDHLHVSAAVTRRQHSKLGMTMATSSRHSVHMSALLNRNRSIVQQQLQAWGTPCPG